MGRTHVSEVKRGVNFIHDIQRGRFIMMKRENQSKGTKGLLATRQITDILPALLGRHDREQNALAEGIKRIHELELRVSAHGDHLVHLLEAQRDRAEPFHEPLEPHPAQVVASLLRRVPLAHCRCQVRRPRRVFFNAASVLR